MKKYVQQAVRKYGYELRKAPAPGFQPLPVLDLALQFLVAKRGQDLTFIEVGANDGISGDPLRTYILEYSWRGLLIEPQPEVFERLKASYAGKDGLLFENVAISGRGEPIVLYRAPAASNTFASSDPKVVAKQAHMRPDQLQKIVVPTTRLDDLVAKHGMTDFDILQLDTEGFDWEVLRTLSLHQTRPLLIGFEHGHLSPQGIGEMTQHLNEHGYFVNFGGYQTDSVALRKDLLAGA